MERLQIITEIATVAPLSAQAASTQNRRQRAPTRSFSRTPSLFPGPYTPKDQASDVQAAITALGLVKPAIVGWSFGGVVTLDYLATYGPGSVSTVMFVDAGYSNSSAAGAPSLFGTGLTDNVPLMLSDDAAENARGTLQFLQACSAAPLPHSDLEFALAYNMLATPASRQEALTGRPGAPEDYDKNVMAALRLAGVPVLAMTGARDNIVLPFAARDIATATGGALVTYPNVGHMPFIEASTRFNADLAALVG